MNGILGYAQVLQRDKQITQSQSKAANIIYNSGEHLLSVINDILDMSKIEARRMDLHSVAFHLPGSIHNLIEIVKIRAKEKGLVLCEDIPSDLPPYVFADEKRLRQVILNLLSNAIKFTAQGNVIFRIKMLNLQAKNRKNKNIDLLKFLVHLRFEIEDQGIGIPHDQLENIFLPFHQVKNSRFNQEGTGLGLPISQKLVGMMGGKIEVKSIIEKGSTFWFDIEIPIISDISGGSESLIPQQAKRIVGFKGNSVKILIADNNKENCSLLTDILKPLGFTTFEVSNGKEALYKAIEWNPDMILIDLAMSVKDSFNAVEQIRQDIALSKTVIIAISSSVSERTYEHSIEVGCSDYLAKPIQVDQLLQKIQQHLNIKWLNESEEPHKLAEPMPAKQTEIIPPSQKGLEDLLILANSGDVFGIQEYSAKIMEKDPIFQPFCNKIKNLSDSFLIDELQSFIKQYMDKEAGQ